MKRNLLAIAIPALLVAGAANASIEIWNKDGNKLNVNGRVYALNYLAIGSSDDAKDLEGDNTKARLGFTGETQITDSISGYGRAEWETNTGKGSSVETRYAFAGINFGKGGSIDYGRNDGVLKAITAYTDVLPEFGGDASDKAYVLSTRSDAVLTYRNAALVDGLSFALQYADDKEYNAEGYGLNAQYEIADTGLTVGAAYAQLTHDKNLKSWNAGIKYDANNLYLAAIYTNTKNVVPGAKTKLNGVEFVAQYGIDFEVGRLTPSLAYVQHKLKNPKADAVKYVEAGMQYDFNKNLTAVVDYKFNLLDDVKDTLALGLIYQF